MSRSLTAVDTGPLDCSLPPRRPVLRFPVCGGLNNMVQASLNAIELAQLMNYTLCPPGVYYDFMKNRKKHRFGEMFDEQYMRSMLYKRGVCFISSLNGDADHFCRAKGDVNMASAHVSNRLKNGTLMSVLNGKGLRLLNCPFYMRLANFSDAGLFRPNPKTQKIVDGIRDKLKKSQVGPLIAIHLRVEGDFERHCKGKKPNCFRTVDQIIETACTRLHLPCKQSTVYVMTGTTRDKYLPQMEPHFGKVYDKEMLLGQVLNMGRERMALMDITIAREADYALGTWQSTFTRALMGMRGQDGRLTLLYSHDRDIGCLPDVRAHMKSIGREKELPDGYGCWKEYRAAVGGKGKPKPLPPVAAGAAAGALRGEVVVHHGSASGGGGNMLTAAGLGTGGVVAKVPSEPMSSSDMVAAEVATWGDA